MSLAGQAVVAIWNDIEPGARDNFEEWHNRQHIPERVGIPGFLRGRRYIARTGAPQYFTLYEAESAEVLVGQDYLNRLNNPTDWTRQSTAAFRNTSRGICRVVLSLGVAQGGFMLTLRFGAEAGREAELRRHLAHVALPPLIDVQNVVGVHFCISDAAASGLETAERKGRTVGVPDWLVMIEAGSAEAAGAACDRLLASGLVEHGALQGMDRGVYALEVSRVKMPGSAG
jgi:hypothetical protein